MRHSFIILWPAFLTAAAIEMLVFGFVDPSDVQWMGRALPLSPLGVYTVAFFLFWAVIIAGFLLASPLRTARICIEADQGRDDHESAQ